MVLSQLSSRFRDDNCGSMDGVTIHGNISREIGCKLRGCNFEDGLDYLQSLDATLYTSVHKNTFGQPVIIYTWRVETENRRMMIRWQPRTYGPKKFYMEWHVREFDAVDPTICLRG